MGQTERAVEHYQQALAITSETGDRSSEGTRLGSLGRIYSTLGQTERRSSTTSRPWPSPSRSAISAAKARSWAISATFTEAGQTELAIEHYQQALAIARETGDRSLEGGVLGNLGYSYRRLG